MNKKIFFLLILNMFSILSAMEINLPSEEDTPKSDEQFAKLIQNLEPGQLITTRKNADDTKESWRVIAGDSLKHTLSHEGKDEKTQEYYLLLKSAKENKYLITIKEVSTVTTGHESHQGAKLVVPESIRNLKMHDQKLSDVQKKGLNKIECYDETLACEKILYDDKTKRLAIASNKGIEYFDYEDPKTRHKGVREFKIVKNTFGKTGNGAVTYALSKGTFSFYRIERTDVFVNPDGKAENPNNCAYSFDWNHNALNWRKIIGVSTAAAATMGILGAVYVKWFKK
jgi:hypothetical protein